jgi:hypothetical protein
VNLRCTICRGDCPVCGVACCKYEAARRTIANAEYRSEEASNARQILQMIESLKCHVLGMSTLSLCSQPGGCGRHVCPNCCGRCPSEICGDIQCRVGFLYFFVVVFYLQMPGMMVVKFIHVIGMQA